MACLDYAHAVSSEICDRNDLGLAYILSFKRNILRFLIRSRNMTFFRQTLSIFPEIHKILIEEGETISLECASKVVLVGSITWLPNVGILSL